MIATQIEKEVTFLCGETICYNLFITLQSKNPEYFVPLAMVCLFTNSRKLQAVFTFPLTKGQNNVNHFFRSENSEIPFSVLMTSSKNISRNKLKMPIFFHLVLYKISWFCTGWVINKI